MVKAVVRRNTCRTGSSSRAGSLTPVPEASYASFASSVVMNPDSVHSPLYLHSADHPGMLIVSNKLDGSNYNQWASAMKTALDAKNKIVFVDGSAPRPEEGNPLSRVWSRCNSMVKSWLLNSVSKQIYGSILNFDDASQIWVDLHNRFHMTNLPRTFQLVQQIQDLRQGSMDLATYYTTLKTLWDNLDAAEVSEPCFCCHKFHCRGQLDAKSKVERGRIIKFLAGLNEKYSVIRGQILMKKPLPNLAEIYNMLDQDDSQRQFNHTISPSAFQISQAVTPPSVFTENQNMNQPGVLNAVQRRDAKPICSHCGYTGHIADRCYKLHGYPIGWKKGKSFSDKLQQSLKANAAPTISQTSSSATTSSGGLENLIGNLSKDQIQGIIALFSSQLQPANQVQNVASSSNVGTSEASGISFSSSTFSFVGILTVSKHAMTMNAWIVDSGATHHVSHVKEMFIDLDTSAQHHVNLPTGSTIRVGGVGNVL